VTDTYRWVVDDSVTAAAIAESAQYIAGVDVDAALAGFDKAAAAVLHVNTTRPDATGVERVELLRQALQEDQ
jgi:hypothetical protein